MKKISLSVLFLYIADISSSHENAICSRHDICFVAFFLVCVCARACVRACVRVFGLLNNTRIRTLSTNIEYICTRCETGQKSSPKAIHIYRRSDNAGSMLIFLY